MPEKTEQERLLDLIMSLTDEECAYVLKSLSESFPIILDDTLDD